MRKYIDKYSLVMKRSLIIACLTILTLGLTGIMNPIYGQGDVKPEWVMPDHYPKGFDGMGNIDRISVDDSEVVIDDVLMALSPYAKYHTPDVIDITGYFFRKGMNVGYMIGEDGTIISMWLIERERY